MSDKNFDRVFDILDQMVKRESIIRELYPDQKYSGSELSDRTSIATSNISRYLIQLVDNGLIDVIYGVNERGQTIKQYVLSQASIDVINSSQKIASRTKPELKDIASLETFLATLLVPELEEVSRNSIQLISNQYTLRPDSIFFDFILEHLMDPELKNSRRILVISTKNFMRARSRGEKLQLAERLKPILSSLLVDATGGLDTETKKLLNELLVYDLPYEELEVLYLQDLTGGKDPSFYRRLILHNHHDKVPRLRAKMISLHPESDDSIRSKIMAEFPHIS
ncbi:hypothetical protein ACFL0D_04000 [Thermoproteota archaeon]